MHDTAAAFGAAFFRCYADAIEGARVLEVGAGDVNGGLRGCAPLGSRYTGIDVAAGPGIDLVLDDPYSYPFDAASFDIAVSSSCLEHDPMFWLSFSEMCRVVRAGGFIYLNVPSNGVFHRHPTDNWRFYPDAGLALAAWGRRQGHDIRLIESLIGRRRRDLWNDCVMVFARGETPRPLRLLAEIFPRSFNIRVGEEGAIANYSEATEDMMLRSWLAEKLGAPSEPQGDGQASAIEGLICALAEREVALGAAERKAEARSAAAEAQIGVLKRALAEHEAALARREQALADKDAAITALRAELAAREADLAEARRRNTEPSAALATAEDEYASSCQERDRAQRTAGRYEDIADAARSAIEALQTGLAQFDRERAESPAPAESEGGMSGEATSAS